MNGLKNRENLTTTFFGFLYNIGNISIVDSDYLMKNCMDIRIMIEVAET